MAGIGPSSLPFARRASRAKFILWRQGVGEADYPDALSSHDAVGD